MHNGCGHSRPRNGAVQNGLVLGTILWNESCACTFPTSVVSGSWSCCAETKHKKVTFMKGLTVVWKCMKQGMQ